MNNDTPTTIEAWLDRFVDYLSGDSSEAPRLEDLEPNDREEGRSRAFAVSELWGRDASPRTEPSSPVATALGFDQVDNNVAIASSALKAARQSADLTVSALSRQLHQMGWEVSAAELGELETGKRLDIPGTAIPLLVALLGSAATDLMDTRPGPVPGADDPNNPRLRGSFRVAII